MIASGQTLSALPTGSTSSLLLKVRDLQTHFPIRTGTIKAVDGVSFDVQRGKTLCVVGESGSGKSVTARSILQIVDEPGRIMGGSMLLHRADGSSLDLAQLGQRLIDGAAKSMAEDFFKRFDAEMQRQYPQAYAEKVAVAAPAAAALKAVPAVPVWVWGLVALVLAAGLYGLSR